MKKTAKSTAKKAKSKAKKKEGGKRSGGPKTSRADPPEKKIRHGH
jgi:hypothetical protein